MDRANDIAARLSERLRLLKRTTVAWDPADGSSLQKGQVWTVAGGCGDMPTWLWLLVEVLGPDTANAVPLFRWTELAGPGDLLVPAQWAGLLLAVSLELESTLPRAAFGTCEGILPRKALEYVLQGRADLDNPDRRRRYEWGVRYIDALDRRVDYHDGIGEVIEAMQKPVRDAVYAGAAVPDVLPGWILSLGWSVASAWWEGLPVPAAADDGLPRTDCLVVYLDPERESFAPPCARERHTAVSLEFEPLLPGQVSQVCCEWSLGCALPGAVGALVYTALCETPIGNAAVHPREGDTLIVLDQADVPKGVKPIRDPGALRIVVVCRP